MSVAWFDGVTLAAEIALSASTGTYGVWDVSEWDDATWGPDVLWVDVSSYVRRISTSRHFARDLAAWDVGTATVVLDNTDGRFSPANLSGPYVTGGITEIRPWRPIRIRAAYSNITYDVYRGYVVAWQESYIPGPGTGTGDAVVTVPCVDEFGQLSGVDGLEQPPIGGGEMSGKRIQRVLDNAGHTGERSIDIGRVTMQETTLAQNTVTELKLTADSEGGAVYVDGDGTILFDHQHALLEKARSHTVQATFGDSTGELPYRNVQVAYDGDLLTNIAAFARQNGSAQIAADNTSRALYGDSRYTRTDLMAETDPQVLGLAEFYLARYKDPELRVTQIDIAPRRSPSTLFPQVLGRKVRDRIQVIRRPPGGHTITRDVFIAGVSHDIGRAEWTTTFDLWSATVYSTFTTSLWDDGTWDDATFFY